MKHLAILLLLALAEPAHAGQCSSSSSSSSDSSSSDSSSDSSDSSSDSSSSSEPLTPACVDATDVHGYRKCTSFGRWGKTSAIPPFIIELGTSMRQFASPLRSRTGSLTHETEQFSYRVVNPTAEAQSLESAAVANLRFGMALRHGFYVAGDLEWGVVTDSATHAEMTTAGERGMPDIEQTSVTATSALAVGGFRTRLGRLGVGVEAAGGFRVLSYNYSSRYHACETTLSLREAQEVLEARGRLQYFFSPFAAVGVTYGKSLIDDGWIGGIYLGGNTRAFGGH